MHLEQPNQVRAELWTASLGKLSSSQLSLSTPMLFTLKANIEFPCTQHATWTKWSLWQHLKFKSFLLELQVAWVWMISLSRPRLMRLRHLTLSLKKESGHSWIFLVSFPEGTWEIGLLISWCFRIQQQSTEASFFHNSWRELTQLFPQSLCIWIFIHSEFMIFLILLRSLLIYNQLSCNLQNYLPFVF